MPGDADDLNQALEKAGRVADFMEFAELMCNDALDRDESCGGHFREEHQTEEGEALRRRRELRLRRRVGVHRARKHPTLHKEQLDFEDVKLTTRATSDPDETGR